MSTGEIAAPPQAPRRDRAPLAHRAPAIAGVARAAIRTEGLTKRFGSQLAVNDVSLEVPDGSVFGFLGPNGSGKTTTVRLLLGLLTPDAGHAELLGRRMPEASDEVLPSVGALIDGPACYPWLTGRQNLERFDAFGPDPQRKDRARRIDEALARVGLGNAADKRFKAYSLGMRQRLGLANALLRPRRLLILDEPTNGMDPQGTREIRHLVRELAADGATVFVSSHLLAEIEQLCTHVAVMSRGSLLAQGSIAELQVGTEAVVRVETTDVALACAVLSEAGLHPTVTGSAVTAASGPAEAPSLPPAEELVRRLVHAGVGVRRFVIERPSLEETFVAMTGEGFDVAQ
ncbi:MAG: ABC transporter ATP-binding protein [Acidimicrobiales bacterium]|nr:ABC transporter ATP-binding protein [Acidimicrobiales bacterium]